MFQIETSPVSDRSSTRADERLDKKADGICVERGCAERASDEAVRCPRHLRAHRKSGRRSRRKRRQELSAQGKCVDCRRKSGTYRCAACSVKRGRIPTVGVGDGVGGKPGTPSQWRIEPGTTWNRYRGKGRRGNPGTAPSDAQDLRCARDEIDKASAAIAYAQSDAVRALPRIQRQGVMAAALALLDYAERWIDEVRNRHKCR